MTEFNQGHLECIVGCMFSGKTEEMMRRLRRAAIAKQPVQLFKPSGEQWWGSEPKVVSHHRTEMPATPVPAENPRMMLELLKPETLVVGVDEAHFFGSEITEVCEELVKRSIRVILAMLDLDYRGQPFGSAPLLLTLADMVDKRSAVCTICGKAATRTYRLFESQNQVEIGADGKYDARCRLHFAPPQA